jgi:peroxiredoxin
MATSPRLWVSCWTAAASAWASAASFAAVINDGVVEQLHVEAPGDFKVSAAEYVLENL